MSIIDDDIINSVNMICSNLQRNIVESAVNIIFSELSLALICGDKVQIRGCFSMEVKNKGEMSIYNPKLKQVLKISEKRKVKFKASKKILEALNFNQDGSV